jgi:hypothetical protein
MASNSGLTALLIIGAGVGGYALWRWSKKGSHHAGFFTGASPCGVYEYWDDQLKACVPLALPTPETSKPVHCPPGQFYDYLRGACVPASAHAAGYYMAGARGAQHHFHQQQQQQPQQMQPQDLQGQQGGMPGGEMDPSMQQWMPQQQQPFGQHPNVYGQHGYGQHGFRGRH